MNWYLVPALTEPAGVIVALTARHHACEVTGSSVLEGFVQTLLGDDGQARRLREHAEYVVVPFVDPDGVEDGDQGKNRWPRDHNRDYGHPGTWPEPRAIRRLLTARGAGKRLVTIDCHSPHIEGEDSEAIYFPGERVAELWARQEELGALLGVERRGVLPYDPVNNVPWGVRWNNAGGFRRGKSFANWASEQPGILLATAVEVPYANASGAVVNYSAARQFGQDLARAFGTWLSGAGRSESPAAATGTTSGSGVGHR